LQDILSIFYDSLNTHCSPDKIVERLSSSLQVEIAMHISLPLLKANSLFAQCSSGFAASLAVLLHEHTMAADEVLFRNNDICSGMYLIASGHVHITTEPSGHQDPV
jgi:hypothetical protein